MNIAKFLVPILSIFLLAGCGSNTPSVEEQAQKDACSLAKEYLISSQPDIDSTDQMKCLFTNNFSTKKENFTEVSIEPTAKYPGYDDFVKMKDKTDNYQPPALFVDYKNQLVQDISKSKIPFIKENGTFRELTLQDPANNEEPPDKTTVTILVPSDIAKYKTQMAEYVQVGGVEDPSKTIDFVEKEIKIQSTSDVIKATAKLAAEEIKPGGGPDNASVSYFKIVDKTAYILLNIDLDGYAGVSVSIAEIHPLIEKSLLRLDEIDRVIFDYAPEDK